MAEIGAGRQQHGARRSIAGRPRAASAVRRVRPIAAANTGLSAIPSRTHRPTPTSTALAMNGTRHPHAANSAEATEVDATRNTRFDKMMPAGRPEGDDAAEESAAALGRVLDRHQDGAAPLATEREPLDEAQRRRAAPAPTRRSVA